MMIFYHERFFESNRLRNAMMNDLMIRGGKLSCQFHREPVFLSFLRDPVRATLIEGCFYRDRDVSPWRVCYTDLRS